MLRYAKGGLWDIRRAYSLAFAKKKTGETVATAVDVALADTGLDALAQVRNVIVHKAGVADAEYETNRKTLPSVPQVEEGKLIPLDGRTVQTLINPVIASCQQLFAAVDEWLADGLSPPGYGAGI